MMYFKKFEDLTFADHYMFEKVLHENQDICQELLERLLKIKIDHITYPEIEKTISPYYQSKDCGSRMSHHNKSGDILVKPKFAEFTRQGCRVNGFI